MGGSATTGAFGSGVEQAAVSQCIEGKPGGLMGTGSVSKRARGVAAEGEEGANIGVGEWVAGWTGSF